VDRVVVDAHATEFLATGTAVRRLADERKLPDTTPKPTSHPRPGRLTAVP
jgi:hypothetical protein